MIVVNFVNRSSENWDWVRPPLPLPLWDKIQKFDGKKIDGNFWVPNFTHQ